MDEDDWRSSASESEIGRRDLARLENELVSDGYREGVTSAREAGMQRVSVSSSSSSSEACVGSSRASLRSSARRTQAAAFSGPSRRWRCSKAVTTSSRRRPRAPEPRSSTTRWLWATTRRCVRCWSATSPATLSSGSSTKTGLESHSPNCRTTLSLRGTRTSQPRRSLRARLAGRLAGETKNMSQGEKALNPIAAALGFPGLYWWQSDDAGAVDNANEDNFWTQLVIAAGIVDESYIRTESKKATEAEKQLVEEEQERQRLEAAAAAESNAAAQGVGGQEVSAREVVVPPVPKPPPRLGEADFSLHRPLGRGRFGEVLLATHRTSRSIVALKVLHKELLWNSKMRERARNEFKINVTLLRAGEHPFIVRLMFAFSTRRCLCLALDVAPCGELFQLTTNHEPGSFLGKTQGRRFPEKAARFYVSECLLALEFLHEAKVLYRDLKPENVLLAEDGHVKISDFGLSKPNVSKPLEGAKSMCGTPEYMAPEILQNNHDHGLAIDWWALGALCYELVDGHPPWHAKDRTQLFDKIVKTSLKMPKNVKPKLSVDCLDLLKTLLEKNAPKRLGVEGATQVKNHKFFAMVDFEALFERKIDPPFQPKPPAPTKLDTTVDLDWASIQPQQAPPRGMDITWEKFDQIFNGFEYRADLTAN